MSESKAKWDEVGDRFNDVAKRVKDHFETQTVADVQDEATTESADTSEKVSAALRQISARARCRLHHDRRIAARSRHARRPEAAPAPPWPTPCPPPSRKSPKR